MKNQYVGDIGDYGKYGLLRFLADHGIKIGVNWYLTEKDGSSDGKFTDYLRKELKSAPKRNCDKKLFDALKKIALLPDGSDNKDKSVHMIEAEGILPGTVFYHKELKNDGSNIAARRQNREDWFKGSLAELADAELIFADPDNGISYWKKRGTKDSEKYILPNEVEQYYKNGKDVVFYCHKGRRTKDAWEKAKTDILKGLPEAQSLVLTYHRGTQRSYIFVLHPEHYDNYEKILKKFGETLWMREGHFTREQQLEKVKP